MAKRQPVESAPTWPTAATLAALPNVAGSPTQSGNLEVGDLCFVASAGVFYACTVATLGAAAWVPSGAPTLAELSGFASTNYYLGTETFAGASQIVFAAIYRRINAGGNFQRICGTMDASDHGWTLYAHPYYTESGIFDVAAGTQRLSPVFASDGYNAGVGYHILVGQATVNGATVTVDTVVDGVPTQNPLSVASAAATFPTTAANKFAIGCGGGDPTTAPGVDLHVVSCAYRKTALGNFYKEAAQLAADSMALGYLAPPTSGAWAAAYRVSDNPGATWNPYVGTDVLTRVGALTQTTITNPKWG